MTTKPLLLRLLLLLAYGPELAVVEFVCEWRVNRAAVGGVREDVAAVLSHLLLVQEGLHARVEVEIASTSAIPGQVGDIARSRTDEQ